MHQNLAWTVVAGGSILNLEHIFIQFTPIIKTHKKKQTIILCFRSLHSVTLFLACRIKLVKVSTIAPINKKRRSKRYYFEFVIFKKVYLSPGVSTVPLLEPNPGKHEHLPVAALHMPWPEHSASSFVPAPSINRGEYEYVKYVSRLMGWGGMEWKNYYM